MQQHLRTVSRAQSRFKIRDKSLPFGGVRDRGRDLVVGGVVGASISSIHLSHRYCRSPSSQIA